MIWERQWILGHFEGQSKRFSPIFLYIGYIYYSSVFNSMVEMVEISYDQKEVWLERVK